jgi:hypothetical protein
MTSEVYHKKTWIDWLVLVGVIAAAALVMGLSLKNTTFVAHLLRVSPILAAGLVEVFFGILLLLRGRQRATKRHVPPFVDRLYFGSFIVVTFINCYGSAVSSGNLWLGLIWGLITSGGLWGMETIGVWWLTEREKPREETFREKRRKIERQIKEEKAIQWLEWRLWVAKKRHPKLVKAARKEEEARKAVEADGLPEYFLQSVQSEQIEQIIAEPISRPVPSAVPVPIREIGFHAEMSKSQEPQGTEQDERTANTKTERAVQYVRELIARGEQYSASTVAKAIGCGRTTAHEAIKKAKKMGE